MKDQNLKELVTGMHKGDKSSLAYLISLVEKEGPNVPEIMALVTPYLHHTSCKIGITGLAGAGKSTLIDKLTSIYRGQGLSVGIIAIDPSSSISGGAILGDRIRMQQHYLDAGVFIRSMATRGHYGGLSKAVDNTVKLLEVSGRDIILIETTGVGQTETEITRVADIVVVVLVPGFGDSIQLMKAGLLEIADLVVVNKADREGAEILAGEIRDELAYITKKTVPSVIMTEAVNGSGIAELALEIARLGKNQQITPFYIEHYGKEPHASG